MLHKRAKPILPPYLLPHSARELKPYTPILFSPSPPRANSNPILPPYFIPHLRARTQTLYSPLTYTLTSARELKPLPSPSAHPSAHTFTLLHIYTYTQPTIYIYIYIYIYTHTNTHTHTHTQTHTQTHTHTHTRTHTHTHRSIIEQESQLVPFLGFSAVGSDPCTLQVYFAAVVVSFASYVGLSFALWAKETCPMHAAAHPAQPVVSTATRFIGLSPPGNSYPPPHMTCMYPPPHMTTLDAIGLCPPEKHVSSSSYDMVMYPPPHAQPVSHDYVLM